MQGKLAGPILKVLPGTADTLPIPIKWLVKMSAMANHPDLTALVCAAPWVEGPAYMWTSCGAIWTRDSAPPVEPESFTACPAVLAHPEADRWTRPEFSTPFFDRLAGKKRFVSLRDGGHMPVEHRSSADLRQATQDFLDEFVLPG